MQKYPDVALRAILNSAQQQVEGFRPAEEIKRVLHQACEVKTSNPALIYKIDSKIGQGNFGTVFKVLNLNTEKHYALKFTKPQKRGERE